MAFAAVSYIASQFENQAGYWIKFYEQGTTTPKVMATDSTGGTTLAKAEISSGGTVPIGFIQTVGDAILTPFVDGAYDLWAFPSSAEADANNTTNAIQLADNITSPVPFGAGEITKSFATVAAMVAADDILLNDWIGVEDYATGNNSGYLFFKAVAAATGTDDGGSYIDLTASTLQAQQNFPLEKNFKQFGATGDGSTDEDTIINNALVYAATLADTSSQVDIAVTDGTYVFVAITVPSNTRLLGRGGVLKFKDSVAVASQAYYPIQTAVSGSNATIENVIINGNKANNTTFTVCDAITGTGDNIRILNNIIIDPPDSGIMFSSTTNSVCAGNRISGATDVGIYANDSTGSVSKNNLITNNIITDCEDGGISLKRHLEQTTVTNNTIRDCGNGITAEDFGSSVDPDLNIISGNSIIYTGYNHASASKRGISLSGSTNTIVSNNLINDTERQAILVSGSSGCTITNNNIFCVPSTGHATLNIGIDVSARTGHSSTNNIIANNLINDSLYYGIHLKNNASGTNTGNSVYGNKVISAGHHAMRVESEFTSCEFYDNHLDGTTWDINYAISNGTTANNRFFNNTLVNSLITGSTGALTAGYHSTVGANKQTHGTAPPTIGSWIVGDSCYNSAITAGDELGWVCTVAGTPGTWIQFGSSESANAYTPTNVVADRSYDANSTTTAELADVLGTLIADLQSGGILK